MRIILLGDSIFDNGAYSQPDVIAQLRLLIPEHRATLLAADGATTQDIENQIKRIPSDATHLVMSVGGNDILSSFGLIEPDDFEDKYLAAIRAAMRPGLPLAICTIYGTNLPSELGVKTLLDKFNERILRTALRHNLSVIDLRIICCEPVDYANELEPSAIGGMKIAKAIANQLRPDRGAS
jgi:GDSL-like Lipase/Acylhydrolase family